MIAQYASDGLLRGDLITLEICRMYGWTFSQYLAQPHWFTELAIEKMSIDNKKAKAEAERMRQ